MMAANVKERPEEAVRSAYEQARLTGDREGYIRARLFKLFYPRRGLPGSREDYPALELRYFRIQVPRRWKRRCFVQRPVRIVAVNDILDCHDAFYLV